MLAAAANGNCCTWSITIRMVDSYFHESVHEAV
jgi:hypothetical protein